MSEIITALKITEALKNLHVGPSWAFFTELRSRPGYSGHIGYIDAYAVGLWESNNSFIAYEIKVSRSDFKSDIEKFADKQLVALRNSTQFYYVCPKGLIQSSEVPDVCGLMELDAGGLKKTKVAPYRELKDGAMDINFNRAMLRAVSTPVNERKDLWKLLGKDLTEAEIEAYIKAKIKSQKDDEVGHRVACKIDEEQKKVWKVLTLFFEASGLGTYIDKRDSAEAIALKLLQGYKDTQKVLNAYRNLSFNIKNAKVLISELEKAILENKDSENKDSVVEKNIKETC